MVYVSKLLGIELGDFLGVYCLFGMAFHYIINNKPEWFESDFHFWYVNGYKPDPELKQEIVEEKPVDETKLSYSHGNGEGGRHNRARNSWRR